MNLQTLLKSLTKYTFKLGESSVCLSKDSLKKIEPLGGQKVKLKCILQVQLLESFVGKRKRERPAWL